MAIFQKNLVSKLHAPSILLHVFIVNLCKTSPILLATVSLSLPDIDLSLVPLTSIVIHQHH